MKFTFWQIRLHDFILSIFIKVFLKTQQASPKDETNVEKETRITIENSKNVEIIKSYPRAVLSIVTEQNDKKNKHHTENVEVVRKSFTKQN